MTVSDKLPQIYSICVIGNSHTAALYYAWKNCRPAVAPGVSLTFFAAQTSHLQYLTFTNTSLIPDEPELARRLSYTSGGRYCIEIGAYDAFILVGLGVRPDVSVLCEQYGWTDHLRWGGVATLVSKTCFDEILAASLTQNLAFHLLDTIRSASSAPVLISPVPFHVEQPQPTDGLKSEARRETIVRLVMEAGSTFARDRGGEILWQDEATIASPGVTKTKFSRNGLILQDKSPTDDGRHMNEKFGYIALMALLGRLDEISGGHVLARGDRAARSEGHANELPNRLVI